MGKKTKNTPRSVKLEIKALSSIENEQIIKLLRKYKVQLFADQDHKQVVPGFQKVLNNLNYSLVKAPNHPWEIIYNFQKSKGVTKILLHNSFDKNKPSFIFHHGLAVLTPIHLKLLANKGVFNKFNVFSIKAAHHDTPNSILKHCINNFPNLISCVSSSVIAMEKIVNFHKNNSSKFCICTGISMGGIVSSLHYFYFNTANYYFPIIAYPNFSEILLSKNLKPLVKNYEKLRKNKSIISSFKIPDNLKGESNDKVIPILGKYDKFVDYKKADEFWSGYPKKSLDIGHYSILLKMEEVRKIILEKTDP